MDRIQEELQKEPTLLKRVLESFGIEDSRAEEIVREFLNYKAADHLLQDALQKKGVNLPEKTKMELVEVLATKLNAITKLIENRLEKADDLEKEIDRLREKLLKRRQE